MPFRNLFGPFSSTTKGFIRPLTLRRAIALARKTATTIKTISRLRILLIGAWTGCHCETDPDNPIRGRNRADALKGVFFPLYLFLGRLRSLHGCDDGRMSAEVDPLHGLFCLIMSNQGARLVYDGNVNTVSRIPFQQNTEAAQSDVAKQISFRHWQAKG